MNSDIEVVAAQWHKGVTETRRLWVRSPLEKMNYFLIFSFLRSGTKAKVRRGVPPLNTKCLEKFGAKWGTECESERNVNESYHYVPSAYPPAVCGI